jgi:hypothetical protein
METIFAMVSRALRVAAVGAAVAALLVVAPVAGGRTTANPALQVHFSLTGTITVTLPDGTPVGVTSGPPTVIPAGYYTVLLFGPGGCANIPYFDLNGPGESISNNLTEGELDNDTVNAYFQPNSTYTWRNRANPGTVYTFVTSGQVAGAPPAHAGPGGLSSSNHTTVSSTDFVGSAILPLRGTIKVAVTSAGKLTLAYDGKSVSRLKAGRYTLAVADESATSGFMLQKKGHVAKLITSRKFVGKQSVVKFELTAGSWIFAPSGGGKQSFTIPVSAAL